MSLTRCVFKSLYWFCGIAMISLCFKFFADWEPLLETYICFFLLVGVCIGMWSAFVITDHALPPSLRRKRVELRRGVIESWSQVEAWQYDRPPVSHPETPIYYTVSDGPAAK